MGSRRVTVAAGALALLTVLSGCSGDSQAAADFTGTVLDPPFEVSSTPLVDTDGAPYSLTADTDKRLTLVFFGFTHCPDICGIVMNNIAGAIKHRLDDADRDQVDVVFVTTDPARDTGPVLRRYLDRIDPDFIGLTGDLDTIVGVADPLGIGITQGQKLPSGGYDVTHSTQVIGIDSDDEAPVYWGERTTPGEFADDIHTLLGEAVMSGFLTTLSIPSPSTGVWHLGPLPLRGYALAIILGIIVAIAISERRWVARGGRSGEMQDVAIWAVPFGLVGGRIYHVATDHDLYFGAGRHPIDVFKVWEGGLGLWGAIGLGAVGAVLGARRHGIRLLPVLDTMAPGCLIAQALGRWGNWFNQELYGKPTDLPWGLEIDPQHYPRGREFPPGTTFHPTFLYEFTWDLLVFAVVVWADRKFKMGHGRVVALYVMGYTIGRGLIENLRIDTVELDDVGGLRFNVWTSIVLFVLAAAYFAYSSRRHPGREPSVYAEGREPVPADVQPADSDHPAP